MAKNTQRFFLDNKHSYCFLILTTFLVVSVSIVGLSIWGMRNQYQREAMRLQLQGDQLRNMLKSEMTEKQNLQRRMLDAKDSLRELDLVMNNEKHAQQQAQQSNDRLQQEIDSLLSNQRPNPLPQQPAAFSPPTNTNSNSGIKGSSSFSVTPKEQQEAVKRTFLHAWNSYRDYAWGKDELNPLDKSFKNWLDLGCTVVDALDTLWIMDFKTEFKEARDWVAEHLTFDKPRSVSFFETTIRELGGLLSAYELSRDKVFLDKAEDLAQRLLKAFPPNGKIPHASVNLFTGAGNSPSWTGGASILSEIASVQLEFLYLAYHTGNPEYARQPMEVFTHLDSLPKDMEGLYPLYVNVNSGQFTKKGDISIGALGDSFYEYMVKLWLLTDKQATGYKRMYEESARGMQAHLVQTSPSGYRYMSQMGNGRVQNKMEHLTCFTGGMFALGAIEGVTPEVSTHLKLGADLTETCHKAYDSTATKLGPEVFFFDNAEFEVRGSAAHYILRPEVVESYFILWRSTHEQKYRDWAWEAYLAMEQYCKREAGYAGVRNVNQIPVSHDDTQQTFFLAETLKYLYLIFCDDDVVPIGDYVFNTEAHPLGRIKVPVSQWNADIRSTLLMK